MNEETKLLKRIEVEINKTPTGELRNLLCDINIALLTAHTEKDMPSDEEIRIYVDEEVNLFEIKTNEDVINLLYYYTKQLLNKNRHEMDE